MFGPPTGAGAPSGPDRVTVILTVMNDPRVARTLESLLGQTRVPDLIIVDDGGGTDEVARITARFSARDPRVRYLLAPGNIPESRNAALAVVEGEFVAFIDADEVAPPGWLAALLQPFTDPHVGFVGGSTPALPESLRSIGARYYDGYLRRFYDRVARVRPHALPMGNSAWRTQVFRDVGLLDTSLYRRAASEDQEIAHRALGRGWNGVFVPEAWIWHDFSDLSTWKLLKKQRVYSEGGYVVWRRAGTTYEASVVRLLPFLLGPLLAIAGAILFWPIQTRGWGELLLAAGAVELALLAIGLTLQGIARDRQYPGLRWAAIEIPRRWATLYGAFRGLLTFGVSGRRRPSAEKP
jgi:glycosyltransferase involved in cell wall biosynthesis